MADVTGAPWDGDAARFTLEQWKRSCLIDRGGDGGTKVQYALPVREPTGELSRAGLVAAAGRLDQVQGISAAQRAAAARKLVELYALVGMQAPDHLQQLAGARSAAPAGNAEVRTGVERRAVPIPVELRALATQDNSRRATIGGYAAVFGRDSRLIPGHSGHSAFLERVAHGFFDEERAAGWAGPHGGGVVARYNHSNDFLLGTTQARTLRLAIDGVGLDYSVDLPEHRSDTLELVARGDVGASSFTFVVADNGGDEWSYNGGVTQRTLISNRLVDVAPVGGSLAAYPDATVALRSLAAFLDAPYEDVETYSRSGELRRFFTRSDQPPRGEAMGYPGQTGTMDWRTAHLILMLHKFPPQTEAEIRQRARMLAELRAMRG